jgi:hypothetical protein
MARRLLVDQPSSYVLHLLEVVRMVEEAIRDEEGEVEREAAESDEVSFVPAVQRCTLQLKPEHTIRYEG